MGPGPTASVCHVCTAHVSSSRNKCPRILPRVCCTVGSTRPVRTGRSGAAFACVGRGRSYRGGPATWPRAPRALPAPHGLPFIWLGCGVEETCGVAATSRTVPWRSATCPSRAPHHPTPLGRTVPALAAPLPPPPWPPGGWHRFSHMGWFCFLLPACAVTIRGRALPEDYALPP
jgi:hypothetical protein